MHATDSSIIRLHRLHVVPCLGQRYFIIRWGGTSTIAVNETALAAMQAMDGHSVRQAQESIQMRLGSSACPDLAPLMELLTRANLVRSIDGVRLSRPELTPRTVGRFLFCFYVSPLVVRAAEHVVSPGAMPRILSFLHSLGHRSTVDAQMERSRKNIALIFHDRDAEDIKAIQREQGRYINRIKLDPEMLLRKSARSVDRWITRYLRLEAGEFGRTPPEGAVLGVIHMNRFTLAPALLLKNGFRVCVIGTAAASTPMERRLRWYRELTALPGYGDIVFLPNFNLSNVRRAVELLRQGYLVIGNPDAPPPQRATDIAARSSFFGMEYSGLGVASARVRLGTFHVSGAVWFCWLAAYAGVPLFPAAMIPDGRCSRLKIGSPILPSQSDVLRDRVDSIAKSFYSYWELEVLRNPGHWFGWHLLNQWLPSKADHATVEGDEESASGSPRTANIA
jgi:hypothetical protein